MTSATTRINALRRQNATQGLPGLANRIAVFRASDGAACWIHPERAAALGLTIPEPPTPPAPRRRAKRKEKTT